VRLRNTASDLQALRDTFFANEYGVTALDPARTVVDLGAHVGCFALLAHTLGARSVVCVEPDPDNFRLLCENLDELRAAGLGAVALEAAAWEPGMGECGLLPHDHATCHRLGPGGRPVRTATLSVVFDLAPGPVGLVKADVEGAEYGLFRHADPAVLARAGAYAVEVHPDDGEPGEVAAALRRAGFADLHWHAGSGRTGTLQLHASRAPA
jgi:FkbM family methyltransferase